MTPIFQPVLALLLSLMSAIGQWLLKLATLISQAINALLLNGTVDETVSARCYRRNEKWYWSAAEQTLNAVYLVLTFQADHCRRSHERDKRFARLVLFNPSDK